MRTRANRFFHPIECGEERAWLDLKRAAGDLLHAARDAEPVQLTERERFENEQVERALQQVGLSVSHGLL
jgi:hypothetical protein